MSGHVLVSVDNAQRTQNGMRVSNRCLLPGATGIQHTALDAVNPRALIFWRLAEAFHRSYTKWPVLDKRRDFPKRLPQQSFRIVHRSLWRKLGPLHTPTQHVVLTQGRQPIPDGSCLLVNACPSRQPAYHDLH